MFFNIFECGVLGYGSVLSRFWRSRTVFFLFSSYSDCVWRLFGCLLSSFLTAVDGVPSLREPTQEGQARFLKRITFREVRAVFCLPLTSAEALLLSSCLLFPSRPGGSAALTLLRAAACPQTRSSFRADASEPFPCKQLPRPVPNDRPQACVQGLSVRPTRPRWGWSWVCFI